MSHAAPVEARPGELVEAARLWWRAAPSEGSLRRHERRWTLWTCWIALVFAAPGLLLIFLEPLTFPVAVLCFAHGWLIPMLQARRGGRALVPIAGTRGAGAPGTERRADRVALGLLGDLVDHRQRDLLSSTGVALERGALGVWMLGQEGAILVRPGGSRVDCWCIRIAEADGLPAGDRVAHLLLALREDERGFAKVANLNFSGAPWRVRRWLPQRARAALHAARDQARGG
jgi:hypothetical protein